MADSHEHTVEELRRELGAMREQMDNVLRALRDRKDDMSEEASSRLARELEHYRRFARDHAQKVYDAGTAGMEEMSEQVRRNPVASLLIAFGAGCILSCLFRHLR